MGEPRISRRALLGSAVAGAAAIGVGGRAIGLTQRAAAAASLPSPGASGIEHIVVVMMENRSFDHFLGWLPGANGRQAGLSYPDRKGVLHPTWHLSTPQGCGFHDPDHSYEGGRVEFDNGACDGWLRAGTNDIFSIGYYLQSDLPFTGYAAHDWTVCDNYFAAILAETYPNRFYQHAAVTDRLHDATTIS